MSEDATSEAERNENKSQMDMLKSHQKIRAAMDKIRILREKIPNISLEEIQSARTRGRK